MSLLLSAASRKFQALVKVNVILSEVEGSASRGTRMSCGSIRLRSQARFAQDDNKPLIGLETFGIHHLAESVGAEKLRLRHCLAACDEVGQDLADHAGELEAVARK